MKFWNIAYLAILPLKLVWVFLCSCTGLWADYASVPSFFLACVLFVTVRPYNGVLIMLLFSVCCWTLISNSGCAVGKMHAKQMQCSRWWDNWWPVKWSVWFPSLHSGSRNKSCTGLSSDVQVSLLDVTNVGLFICIYARLSLQCKQSYAGCYQAFF